MSSQNLNQSVYASALARRVPHWPSPAPSLSVVSWRWPTPERVRMRNIFSRATMRAIYRYPSRKLQRSVQLESALEHTMAVLFDTCPTVESFAEQPVEITLHHPSGVQRHIPDFAMVQHGQRFFVEAKFARDVDADVQWRTERLIETLSPLGIGYRLATEKSLPSRIRQSNARVLSQRARAGADEIAKQLMVQRVDELGVCTLADIGWSNATRAGVVATCLAEGILHADLSAPLHDGSAVSTKAHQEGWLWASQH